MSLQKLSTNQRQKKGHMRTKIKTIGRSKVEVLSDPRTHVDTRVTLIQALIPLGLKAVEEELQREVKNLVGGKHERNENALVRWGKNPGSVYLGGQKVRVKVPRVRNQDKGCEQPLQAYQALQNPRLIENQVLSQVIFGLSQGRYEDASIRVAETFGISGSSVSRKFIRASSKRLEELMNRDLSKDDFIVIFLDGKKFADTGIIVVVGVTMAGEKKILGLLEAATENTKVVKEYFERLVERGLKTEHEMLVVVDGSKGLRKGVEAVLGKKAIIQRCQFHKAENVVSYLPKLHQEEMRLKLKRAYSADTYDEAVIRLGKIRKELKLMNQSALASLEEGFEETLTLHRLGVFRELGRSLKTTNCIESILSQVAQFTDRVDYWKNSNQRQRWLASALFEVEKNIHRIKGHQHLPMLRQVMKEQISFENKKCA